MPQPTYADLFGPGATLDGSNNLTIPYAALQAAGISGNPPAALESYAAVTKTASTWLAANTDEAVQASVEQRITAPSVRNGVDRTEFVYSTSFYGNYNAPTFDPDEV